MTKCLLIQSSSQSTRYFSSKTAKGPAKHIDISQTSISQEKMGFVRFGFKQDYSLKSHIPGFLSSSSTLLMLYSLTLTIARST